MKTRKRIYIAMSGGVDSSVAAYLLQKDGFDVIGVYMHHYDDCTSLCEERWALRAAAHLDIPLVTWDFRSEYQKRVLSHFFNGYRNGITPNPDVLCNKEIKFGFFMNRARAEGGDAIATGHYVRKFQIQNHKSQKDEYRLRKARDREKDQSYFLWTLQGVDLSYIHFPVGELTKGEVRSIAKRIGLPNYAKKDSQGLCFVGNISFDEFMVKNVPEKPGVVLNIEGVAIGSHRGAHLYTEGQRMGIGVGGQKQPLYVTSRDVSQNTITLAEREHPSNYTTEVLLTDVHIIDTSPLKDGAFAVKIRYRQEDQKATVYFSDNPARIVFETPQFAVSPGQSAVIYDGERLVGGGIIKSLTKLSTLTLPMYEPLNVKS